MRFGVLGPVEARTEDGAPVKVADRKVRALLADLLVHAGRVVPAGRLVDDLWGDALPANPAATLQARVSQLRRTLEDAEPGGRALVESRRPGYRLTVRAADASRFEELTERAAAADPARRAALLTDALARWRGPAYADFDDAPFAAPEIARLEELRLAAVEGRAEARLELGDHAALAAELGALVAEHPLRERLRAAYLRALYRAGRPGEALASYADLRRRLRDDLGLDPGPELAALHGAILRRDPAEAGFRSPVTTNPATTTSATTNPSTTNSAATNPAATNPAATNPAATNPAATNPAATNPAATDSATTNPSMTNPATTNPPATNLPADVTELVGRNGALADVAAALDGPRLVTLHGPGGVGKTRLAVAAARWRLGRHPGGVWLVRLDDGARPGASAGDVATLVAGVLGLRDDGNPASGGSTGPAARLADALRGRGALLVLDNCEHVVEAAADLVAALLRDVPDLRVLATSREPLGVSGERLWTVPPLDVPADGADLADLTRYGAVELFAARAADAAPGFALGPGDAAAVAAICARLDGLPLALELAATRVRTLGVAGLARRLDDRFALLAAGARDAPARQRTLRAVIDWSFEPLDAAERAALRRLTVHSGGCTPEAAEAVGGGDAGVLARLVDRSLVTVDGGPRYRLLESVAAYCVERLREAGEEAEIRRRHVRYYTSLAERADPLLRTGEQRDALRELNAESGNIRAALDTAVREGDPGALRLVNAMGWCWFLWGRTADARRAFERALAVPGGDPATRARAQTWHTGFALLDGDGADRDARCRAALAAYDEADDPWARAFAHWFLGFARAGYGDHAEIADSVDAALVGFAALGDPWGEAAALAARAAWALTAGDLGAVRRDGERARELFRATGDRWGGLQTTETLGLLAEVTGDHGRAAALHRAGLRDAEELGFWTEASGKLSRLGRIALLTGAYERADELHERARVLAVRESHRRMENLAVIGLALAARRRGRLDEAETLLLAWLDWCRSVDGAPGLALLLAELGFIAELRGDVAQAFVLHREGLATAETTGNPRAVALALEGMAGAHSLAGAHDEAAAVLAQATAIRAATGAPLPPAEQSDMERINARIQAARTKTATPAGVTVQMS